MKASSPISTFNRSAGKVRQNADMGAWNKACMWLLKPEVVTYFSSRGTVWTLLLWLEALNKLEDGARANVAFGMDKPGRAKSTGFTTYMDAAMYWQILVAQGTNSATALETALTVNNDPGGNPLSESEVYKSRMRLPELNDFDAKTLTALKEGIENKYA